MVLYEITLDTLVEEICAEALYLLAPFYVDDAMSDVLTDRSAKLITLLLERGTAKGYFP